MKITKLHRDVAEALYTQRATPEEIRSRFRIGARTLARWQAEPDFQAVLKEIEARQRRRARWLFVTFAEIAAARLVKLTEADNLETARKACLDVLEKAEVTAETERPADAPEARLPAIDAITRQRIYELLAALPERRPEPQPAEETESTPAAERPARRERVGTSESIAAAERPAEKIPTADEDAEAAPAPLRPPSLPAQPAPMPLVAVPAAALRPAARAGFLFPP